MFVIVCSLNGCTDLNEISYGCRGQSGRTCTLRRRRRKLVFNKTIETYLRYQPFSDFLKSFL